MSDTRQTEWLNQNSLRNYPIREDAQRRPHLSDGSVLGEFILPNYLVTDFIMTVGSEVSTSVYLMKLAVIGNAVTFVLGSGGSTCASVYVDKSSHTTNRGYEFSGVGDYSDAKGCLVVGDLDRLSEDLPDGVYNFDEAETVFEYRCIRPSLKKVASICLQDPTSGYVSKKLRGNVKLIAGQNISLKFDEEKNAIWINADGNAGYNEICDCGSDTTVKTINGISVQNVALVGDDCVSVSTSGRTIKISDKCSKPCCGCAEIDFINEKISQLNTSVRKLDTYANALDTRMTELQGAYVQSDTGSSKKS